MVFELRPYQKEAVRRIYSSFSDCDRVLACMPTGTGKSAVGADVIKWWKLYAQRNNLSPKCLWLAHRGELLTQAMDNIERSSGEVPAVEKAESRASTVDGMFPERIVVASIQTLFNEKRLRQFAPNEFGLVIVDECQHSIAPGFREVIQYFGGKNLGLTATPDRTDAVSLGQIYQDVAFEYSILDSIRDGWSSRIVQQYIEIEGLDWSGVRKSGDDLSAEDIARVIREEEPLHKIVATVSQLAKERQTMVFLPTVEVTEATALLFDRYCPRGAVAISGRDAPDDRKEKIRKYLAGEVQFLCSCALFLEGFDAPATSCIAMCRPTQSRMLYTQAIGRGLRGGPNCPIPGKENCLVLDLVGASLKHKLIHTVDVLAGAMDEAVINEANKKCYQTKDQGEGADPVGELLKAAAQRQKLVAEARMGILAQVRAKRKNVDPFLLLGITDYQKDEDWWKGMPATETQQRRLESAGIITTGLSKKEARRLIQEVEMRSAAGLASPKQARILTSYGYNPNMQAENAKKIIDGIVKRKWKFTRQEAIARQRWVGRLNRAIEEGKSSGLYSPNADGSDDAQQELF